MASVKQAQNPVLGGLADRSVVKSRVGSHWGGAELMFGLRDPSFGRAWGSVQSLGAVHNRYTLCTSPGADGLCLRTCECNHKVSQRKSQLFNDQLLVNAEGWLNTATDV